MTDKLFCPTCHDRLSDAEDTVTTLKATMRLVEWQGRTYTGSQTYRCPWCMGAKPNHTEECTLAKLMRE